MSQYYPPRLYTSIPMTVKIKGVPQRVNAEQEQYVITGDKEAIRPLLEYLFWFHEGSDPNPVPQELLGPLSATNPSWLPSLLIRKWGVGCLNDVELEMLAKYNFTEDTLVSLKPLMGKNGWGLEVAAVNQLWFENPTQRFVDLIQILV